MSTINPAAYVPTTNSTTPTTGSGNGLSGMDSNAFMMLLMAQLKHQNPLEPMDEKEMMNQVTSLNSLQELQAIKESMDKMRLSSEILYASSLIGKTVKAKLADGTLKEGVVASINQSNGEVHIVVGEDDLPLTAVLEVKGD